MTIALQIERSYDRYMKLLLMEVPPLFWGIVGHLLCFHLCEHAASSDFHNPLNWSGPSAYQYKSFDEM
jgi:hypothetical protein